MNGEDLRYCKGCIYLGRAGSEAVCDHILIEKKMRGCPVGVGCSKRNRKGEKNMPGKVWDEARARTLWEEGKSDLDIADMVGATKSAIAGWRYRHGLKSNNPPRARKVTVPVDGEEEAKLPATVLEVPEMKTENDLQAGRQRRLLSLSRMWGRSCLKLRSAMAAAA